MHRLKQDSCGEEAGGKGSTQDVEGPCLHTRTLGPLLGLCAPGSTSVSRWLWEMEQQGLRSDDRNQRSLLDVGYGVLGAGRVLLLCSLHSRKALRISE